jgi:hypothetical protein
MYLRVRSSYSYETLRVIIYDVFRWLGSSIVFGARHRHETRGVPAIELAYLEG